MEKKNKLSIFSFICSALAVVLSLAMVIISPVASMIVGFISVIPIIGWLVAILWILLHILVVISIPVLLILSVVFGIIGLKSSKKGFAIAGLILAALEIVALIIVLATGAFAAILAALIMLISGASGSAVIPLLIF